MSAKRAAATVQTIVARVRAALGANEVGFGVGAALLWYGMAKIYPPAAPIAIGLLLLALALAPAFRKAK